jgi:malonyl-CoA decarboxylase
MRLTSESKGTAMEGSQVLRSLERLRASWDTAKDVPGTDTRARAADAEALATLRQALADCAGETATRAAAERAAASVVTLYARLDVETRREFLRAVTHEFGPDPKAIARAAAAYAPAVGTPRQWEAESALRRALRAPRERLFARLNARVDGLRFLVDMRADLLGLLDRNPDLAALEEELFERLSDAFDIGLLGLESITWQSPAALLEKVMQYEAVHEIRSWSDLKNRLDADRRCYGFFHPRLALEPLIFVEVALTAELSDNIQTLLDEGAPVFPSEAADTAIFYSISNAQKGLRGVSFGNFLLKRVIEDLRSEFPGLNRFATLSPVPLFRMWLDEWLLGKNLFPLSPEEVEPVARLVGLEPGTAALRSALQEHKWADDPALAAALRMPMERMLAHFIANVRKGKAPLDPVARFHLGNGARLERVNWLGDVSKKGFNQSYGMMVNYRYVPEDIDANVANFTAGKRAAVSEVVATLLP